jgi:GNAT superfamily N-acetyltransferase
MPEFIQIARRKLVTFATLLKHRQCFATASRMCNHCLPARFALLGKSHLMLHEGSGPEHRTPVEPVRFGEASVADLGEILQCSGGTCAERLFRNFFAAGHRCYVVRASDRIVGYCWLFFGQYVITHDNYRTSNIVFALDGNNVFIGNVFIDREFRRRGYYSFLLGSVIQEAKASHGRSRFFVNVKADNVTSLRAHARLGFTTVATLFYVGFLHARYLILLSTNDRPRVCRVTSSPVMKL